MHFKLSYPAHWFTQATAEARKNKMRFMVQYNPHLLAIELEALLLDAGVEILYGTLACGTVLENRRITAVIVENKSGRSAIAVDSVIDCTGDADIAAMSGVPTCINTDGNPLAAWYYHITDGQLHLNQFGLADVRNDMEDREQTLTSNLRISGLDAKEVSRFAAAAHQAIGQDVEERRKRGADTVPVTIATIPQLRMTRRIQGETTISQTMPPEQISDSVGLYSDWTKSGPVYALPLRAMYHHTVSNLLVAGRCLSADHDMWNLTRVIPVCVVSGQAAGTAFGIGKDVDSLDITQLQAMLKKAGVRLYPREIC